MTTLIPSFLILVASCYPLDCELSGGLGMQYENATTNDYQRWVGGLRLQSKLNDDFYIACIHVSGISTREPDMGLNYCSVGFRVGF